MRQISALLLSLPLTLAAAEAEGPAPLAPAGEARELIEESGPANQAAPADPAEELSSDAREVAAEPVPAALAPDRAPRAAEPIPEPVPLQAAENPLVLAVESAAELARNHADRVLAARAARAATMADARARVAVVYPQLSANAGYTRYEGLAAAGIPDKAFSTDDSRDEYAASARLEQLLWSFGRIEAALDARTALGHLAGSDLLLAERDAAYRARLAVAQVQLTQAQRWVAAQRVKQRLSELADAEDRRAVGTVTALDVRETRITLLQAQNALRAADTAIERAYNELVTAIAIEDRVVVVEEDLDRPVDMGLLIAAARDNLAAGPEVEALRAQVTLSDAERAEQRGLALPELRAFGAWRTDGPELDDQSDEWQLGLNISWNIYDGGATYARAESAARNRVRLSRLADDQTRERLRQFDDIRAQLDSLSARISAEEEAVQLAEDNYQDARAQYREGIIDRIRVGEANLQITVARLRLLDLIYEEAIAAYQLMRLAE